LQSENLTAFHKIIIVQKRILPKAITAVTLISLIGWNCTKLDTTDIGSDLLPAVDNVNTFADTLSIISTQGVFLPDSTYILRTDDHALGINNDPVFGQTNASIFFQLKPNFYPFFIGGTGDTLNWPGPNGAGVDSVVLCLKYKGSYGDTSTPLQVQVYTVLDNPPYYFRDSTNMYRNVNFRPDIGANIGFSPTTSIDVRRLADTVKYVNRNGFSVNTIRIRLSTAYANAVYNRDTLTSNPFNNAFKNDSLFRRFYNGIGVVPVAGGNQLIYTSLSDADTKLEVHFRRKNLGRVDTLVNTLVLNSNFFGSPSNRSSSTANYITRNRLALPSGDQEVYLQTSPGTFANLNIPALSTLSNRIVHRAELIVDEIPDNSGFADKFRAPNYLYIELKDSGTAKWKPIYYDLNPGQPYDPDYKTPATVSFFPNSVDFLYFGGFIRNKTDVFGNPAHYYNFNITRYVQDIITNHKTNAQFRLSAPFNIKYPQYSDFPSSYGNNIAFGRVKVGGGNNPNYRMRLRIVYSKL
jgi:hypothetical protein